MSANAKGKKNKSNKIIIPLAGAISDTTESNKTGSWKSFKPVVTKKCIGCGNCVLFCPDDCIKLVNKNRKKFAEINYNYCKGCMICASQCPVKAIEKKEN